MRTPWSPPRGGSSIGIPAGRVFPSTYRIVSGEKFLDHFPKKLWGTNLSSYRCFSQLLHLRNTKGVVEEGWSRNSWYVLSTMRRRPFPSPIQPFRYRQWSGPNSYFFHSDRRLPPSEEILKDDLGKPKNIRSRWRERLTRIRYFFMRFRPLTFDDVAAMFSWIFVAHLFLILLATTGSAMIFLYFVNSLQFQGNHHIFP
jgi:hypothetical protein